MKQLDELLSPQDLADYLDVPVSTLYDWRWRGEGPTGFRAGKYIRYRRSDVEEWIQRQLDSRLSHR
jgi:excisionase family DNA binding protein